MKSKPGKAKSFNSDLIKLLKEIDIVPIILSVKDAVVIAQLLADQSDSMFLQDSLLNMLQLLIDHYMEDYKPTSAQMDATKE